MRRTLLLIAFSSLVLFRPSPAAAQYITDLELFDVPGARFTYPRAIDDRGQILGVFGDGAGIQHGFLRSNGQYTTIDVPGATWTDARGFNAAGDIAGSYQDAAGQIHGFLRKGGQFTTIDPPNSVHTEIWGFNDLGEMVGMFMDAGSGTTRNFLRTHGQFVTLTAPQTDRVQGINNRGQIVGTTPSVSLAYRLEPDGDVTTFTLQGSTSFAAVGINSLGEIVGTMNIDLGQPGGPPDEVAFVLAYGTYRLLFVPGVRGTGATSINNRHQIVGIYLDASTPPVRERGWLFTPPNTIADISGSASPDTSRVLDHATVVFDSDLGRWRLGPGDEILRNGVQAAGGYGSQILWYHGSIYVLGDDDNWWRWTGSEWAFAGPTDPSR
jgi:uncharacterized membrane protein